MNDFSKAINDLLENKHNYNLKKLKIVFRNISLYNKLNNANLSPYKELQDCIANAKGNTHSGVKNFIKKYINY